MQEIEGKKEADMIMGFVIEASERNTDALKQEMERIERMPKPLFSDRTEEVLLAASMYISLYLGVIFLIVGLMLSSVVVAAYLR